MTGQQGSDPLDQLRRANPVNLDDLPSESYARIRARIQEVIMMEPGTSQPGWRDRIQQPRLRGLGVAAGAVVAASVVAMLIFGRGGTPVPGPGGTPGMTSGPLGGPVAGSCVETYSLATLTHRSWAFDGTVTAISADRVTFKVNQRFAGTGDTSVTLTATGMTGSAITSIGGPKLAIGERYLVAGEEDFAWACGFTQPYDAAVAAQWRSAFGG
jgi:hypothetical protein